MTAKPADSSNTPSKTSSFSFGTVLRGMVHYPITFLFFFLLAGSIAAGIWFYLPLPKMTGSTVFLVQAQPQAILTPIGDARADFNLYRTAQANMVKNRLVLSAALNDPKVADLPIIRQQSDPIIWLEKNLQVDFKMGPEFMRLTMEGDSEQELKIIIEAIGNAYHKKVLSESSSRNSAALKTYERLYEDYNKVLKENRKRLENTRQSLGTSDSTVLALKEKSFYENIIKVQERLFLTDLEIREKIAMSGDQTNKTKEIEELEIPEEVIARFTANSKEYRDIKAEITALDAKKADYVRAYKDPTSSSGYQTTIQALADKEKELAEYTKRIKPDVVVAIRNEMKANAENKLYSFQDRLEGLKATEKVLTEISGKLLQQLKDMNAGQSALEDLKSDIQQRERIAQRLADAIESMRPEMEADPRVRPWPEREIAATVIDGIEGNRRLKYTLMGGIGLFVLGLSIVTYREGQHGRIVNPKDINKNLGMRVVGTVPAMPRGMSGSVGGDTYGDSPWESVLAECVDTTRTLILNTQSTEKPMRTIMVTSAVGGEGKTSLAGHLAISMARGGFRTLLVDADMRQPSLHELLARDPAPGLSEVLRGEISAEEAVQESEIPGLSILPAGDWCPRVCSALSGNRWRLLKELLQADYDYLIVDTAPLLPVTDALLMARDVDGVVLSVLQGVSQLPNLDEARQRLVMVGATIIGVVVNGVEGKSYRNRYYLRDASTAAV